MGLGMSERQRIQRPIEAATRTDNGRPRRRLFSGINKILRRVTGKENNSYIILVSAVKLDVQISGCDISASNDKTKKKIVSCHTSRLGY